MLKFGNRIIKSNKMKSNKILNKLETLGTSALASDTISFLNLLTKKINTHFPVSAPPVICKIKAGKNVKIGRNCFLRGKIELEDNVSIGKNSILNGIIHVSKGTNLVKNDELVGKIEIGRYCAIGGNVIFEERNHFMHKAGIQMRFYEEIIGEELGSISKGPIIIGNDVWIGTRVIVLSGVKIGDGAIVGAGAIVTRDVQPYEVVAGTPVRHLKWRFPEHVRNQLMEIKWWDWGEEKIKRNKKFFTTDLDKAKDVHELVEE